MVVGIDVHGIFSHLLQSGLNFVDFLGTRRSPTVHIGGRMRGSSNRLMHVRCFANGSSKGKIGLLVGLGEQLESIQMVLVCLLANCVQNSRHVVIGAVNGRCRCSNIFTQTDSSHAVATRALNGCDIKAESVVCLESTAHVEVSIAASKAAWHTCALT